MDVINKVVKRKQTYDIDKSYIQAHKTHRLEHADDYILVDDVVSNFRATGGLKFEHQAYKLWELHQLLQQHRPQSILEFGSGSSSLIFSDYVRKNTGAKLLSIDEDEKWASNTSDLIGIKEKEPIKIQFSHKVVYPNKTIPEIKYDANIEGSYDFVLIDGPSLNVRNIKLKDAINSNFKDLENLPSVIIVDVRQATAEYIAKNYANKYDITLSDIFTRKKVLSGYQYFSVFTKK